MGFWTYQAHQAHKSGLSGGNGRGGFGPPGNGPGGFGPPGHHQAMRNKGRDHHGYGKGHRSYGHSK